MFELTVILVLKFSYPMNVAIISYSPLGTLFISKLPSASVAAPRFVPINTTLEPGRGERDFLSEILPVTENCPKIEPI